MEKIVEVMKRGLFFTIVMILVVLPLMSISAYADEQDIDINTLINESRQYDGEVVTVKGEALLEALERKGFTWVNISDGTNAIGVTMPKEVSDRIKLYGDFKTKGDVLEISAIFNRSCKIHGGDMDLHLIELKSISPGEKITHEIEPSRLIIAGAAFLIMGFSALKYKRNV